MKPNKIIKFIVIGFIVGFFLSLFLWERFLSSDEVIEIYIEPDSLIYDDNSLSLSVSGVDSNKNFFINPRMSKSYTLRKCGGFYIMIYFIKQNEYVKIGTATSVERRVGQIKASTPYECNLILSIPGTFSHEKELHDKFDHLRVKGEWFLYDDELKDFVESLLEEPSESDMEILYSGYRLKELRKNANITMQEVCASGASLGTMRRMEQSHDLEWVQIRTLRKYLNGLGLELVIKFKKM